MNNFIVNFNPSQQKLISFNKRQNILVKGGANSGKTVGIMNYILNYSKTIDNSKRILFLNNFLLADKNVREFLKNFNNLDNFMTFGFFFKLAINLNKILGIPLDTVLYNDNMAMHILSFILKKNNIILKDYELKKFFNNIITIKRNSFKDNYDTSSLNPVDLELYELYQNELRFNRALDYCDLEHLLYIKFKIQDNVIFIREILNNLDLIVIEDIENLSKKSYEILMIIAQSIDAKVLISCDIRQNFYKFKGAELIENIDNFVNKHNPFIVEFQNSYKEKDFSVSKKTFKTEKEEALGIIDILEKLPPEKTKAIITRNNKRLNFIEKALIEYKIIYEKNIDLKDDDIYKVMFYLYFLINHFNEGLFLEFFKKDEIYQLIDEYRATGFCLVDFFNLKNKHSVNKLKNAYQFSKVIFFYEEDDNFKFYMPDYSKDSLKTVQKKDVKPFVRENKDFFFVCLFISKSEKEFCLENNLEFFDLIDLFHRVYGNSFYSLPEIYKMLEITPHLFKLENYNQIYKSLIRKITEKIHSIDFNKLNEKIQNIFFEDIIKFQYYNGIAHSRNNEALINEIVYDNYFMLEDKKSKNLKDFEEIFKIRQSYKLSKIRNLEKTLKFLSTNTETIPIKSSKISLLTAHSSKGKNFDIIIVPSLNNLEFPSIMALKSLEEKKQEQDLFYYIYSKAKSEIILSTYIYDSKGSPIEISDYFKDLEKISKKYE